MSSATQPALDAASLEEHRFAVVRKVLSTGFDQNQLTPAERGTLLGAVGSILVTLGLATRERLPELFDKLASFANEASEASQEPLFADSIREIMKRNRERDLQQLEESRRPGGPVFR